MSLSEFFKKNNTFFAHCYGIVYQPKSPVLQYMSSTTHTNTLMCTCTPTYFEHAYTPVDAPVLSLDEAGEVLHVVEEGAEREVT